MNLKNSRDKYRIVKIKAVCKICEKTDIVEMPVFCLSNAEIENQKIEYTCFSCGHPKQHLAMFIS